MSLITVTASGDVAVVLTCEQVCPCSYARVNCRVADVVAVFSFSADHG
jgi:hypothetical protein